MNRQDLHEIETRCVQEEWPQCQAACPFHVDVREFMSRMRTGDTAGARKTLERSMPLPDLVGRVCDHPCEDRCLRRGLGGALAVSSLERFCLEAAPGSSRAYRMPPKGVSVAALGGGLSSLVLAWELLRKGYSVTLFISDDQPGGRLRTLSEHVLPARILEESLELLKGMGMAVNPVPSLDDELLETVRGSFDAAYVECETDDRPRVSRDEAEASTLRWRENIFCGGWLQEDGAVSSSAQIADGRRAANSIQRLVSGTDMFAAREREGVCLTRSYTNLAGVVPAERLVPADGDGPASANSARAEAGRCLECQCMECVRHCEYLRRHKGYPKLYARQIFSSLYTVQVHHPYNRLINSCMLCGLCTELCPGDFSMADLSLSARREQFKRGRVELLPYDFALKDVAHANGHEFFLFRSAPGEDACAHLFFPGCQLGGEPDGKIPQAYAFLRSRLGGGVGLGLGCCGLPARWAGRFELFEETMEAFRTQWEALGRPRVILACASCRNAFALGAPDIPVISLWRVLAEETGLPVDAGIRPDGPLAVHDPCASRHDAASRAAVRKILAELGVPVEELPMSGSLTQCCGQGGLAGEADRDLALTVASQLAAQSPSDYVAACAMCRDRLARAGKRTYHLLDLMFPGALDDPAGRPDPGFSLRREVRARLRLQMLADVWGEGAEEETPDGLELVVSDDMRRHLEDHRILVDDAAAVVAESEATGKFFIDRESGHFLACRRLEYATFWVEYVLENGRAVLHDAYSHRMEVRVVGGELAAGAGDLRYEPESGSWTCSCGDVLVPTLSDISYLGGRFSVTLLGCPKCGLALVPAYLARGRMVEAERLLEDK